MPIQYFTVTPTVTAGAYSVNDVVGGRMTFTGLRRGSLQTITISDKSAGGPDYLLVLFNDTPTNITDNATYDIADADLSKIIQVVDLNSATTQQSFNDNAIYTLTGLNVPIAAHCAAVSAFLIATASAPTFASTSDISVTLQVDTDYVSGRQPGSTNIAAIEVGDSAGGELGGTLPTPTVNATHSGSSHANLPSGAQVNNVDIVTTSGTQTLTNKTLTTPSISNPTGLDANDVGLGNVDNTSDSTKNSASATLSNKTLAAPSTTGQILSADGSSTLPTYSFTTDGNTGMYNVTANTIGFATNGSLTVAIDADSLNIQSGKTIEIQAASAAGPGLAFSGDNDTGIFSNGANILSFTTGGTERWSISSDGAFNANADQPVRAGDGSASAPGLSFRSDTDIGVYRIGADNLGIAVAGVLQFDVSTDGTRTSDTATAKHTVETSGSANSSVLNLLIPASGTGDARVDFTQGSGNGDANNMGYALGYDGSQGRLYLESQDSDGASGVADLVRIPDGQLTLDANATWDDSVFDDHDDAKILERAFSVEHRETVYRNGQAILRGNYQELIDLGVLRRYEDGWVGYNDQRMAALLAGGIYQTRQRLDRLEARLETMLNGD